jgi:ABC-type branched-subunit amino acid transport system substrate-binding protein
VALFYANSETGIIYRDAFDEFAGDYGIDIVTEQTIEAADSAPPTAQVNAIAAEQPDYIMTVPVGAGCVAFLNELANAKAANPGWEPAVFLSSTCASQLILAAAGPAADDLYTSPTGALKDVGNPEVQANDEQVAEYVAFMTEQGKEATITSGAAGWLVMELTVEMIRQAVESPDGLSRKSIIEVARNIEYTPSLVREGITFAMSGEEDPYLSDTVQVLQFDAETATFTEVGEPVRPDEED